MITPAMPIYEYQCAQCGKVTEAIQKFSDPPLQSCEACGGELKRLMSRTSFHLKGSGWYATDYKKSTSPSPAPAKSDSGGTSTTPPPATPSSNKPSGSES